MTGRSPPKTAKWSEEARHKRVLDKGPHDAMMAYAPLDGPEPVPTHAALTGLCDGGGRKVRLAFKMDTMELVLSLAAATKRIPFAGVHNASSQIIPTHPTYAILRLQCGPTDKSDLFLYWVPAQYIDSIVTMFKR